MVEKTKSTIRRMLAKEAGIKTLKNLRSMFNCLMEFYKALKMQHKNYQEGLIQLK